MRMFEPLYSTQGGPPHGYRCLVARPEGHKCRKKCVERGHACSKVAKTWAGIVIHCKRKHGLELQTEMNFDGKEEGSSTELVRAGGEPAAAAGAAPAGTAAS